MEVAGVVLSGVQTGLSVAQTMFDALQCRELRQICSILGYESELEKLEGTVSTIRAALLDVEAKEANQELSHQERDWVEKLKDALYDADDLLDEFATLAQHQRLLEGEDDVSKKEQVRSWFSIAPFRKMTNALNMYLGVQGIRKKLDGIASDYSKFGFKVNYEPIRRRREETCSYVYEKSVIGREDDKKFVVDKLLEPSNLQDRDISFLGIVGVGGLGKTTLAQLVYNDERVKANFPLRLWFCVADQDDEHLDVKGILCKILNSATGQNYDGSGLEWVQSQFQQLVSGKKYLLVLDDLWSESPVELCKLAGFLTGGQRGSWVVVTTRSRKTARFVGNGHLYELKGLSEEYSWHLFEMAAFGEGQEQPTVELVQIGKKIVAKCAGVPLAISVIGSLLYGQGTSMWLSYQENGIAYTGQRNNDILLILKFSYYHPESSLKSCFSFCALFPKDFVMEKETLIRIWMAHGCVVPFCAGQSLEDASEEHFSILLRRCFFQDVKRDDFGEIYSCKVHDLMHDIAQEVAGKEIFVADPITSSFDNKVRHLFLTQRECVESFITKTKLRTYLHTCFGYWEQKIPVGTVLASWVCIRVLDLGGTHIKILPETIGKLVHLRYLDLARNYDMVSLPQSITNLYNLQTLLLYYCFTLRELPKENLKRIELRFGDQNDDVSGNYTEALVEGLKPHSGLQELALIGYNGAKIPSWTEGVTNLAVISLEDCHRLQYLSSLGKLPHLRLLCLLKLGNLEWMQNTSAADFALGLARIAAEEELFFPSLEHLSLRLLPKLKGWWGSEVDQLDDSFRSCSPPPSFPRLSHLTIFVCPHLTSIPLCPNLEELVLRGLDEPLCPIMTRNDVGEENEKWKASTSLSSSLDMCRHSGNSNKLRTVGIENVRYLNSLPSEAFQCLIEIRVLWDKELESLSEVEDVFRSCSSSLRSLKLIGCHKLRSLGGGGLEHLTALESLSIDADNLDMVKEEEEDGIMPWRSLQHSLRSLRLEGLPKLVELPKGMHHLTSLLSLEFRSCPNLKCLPEWGSCFSSLQSLKIEECENLEGLPEWVCSSSSLRLEMK